MHALRNRLQPDGTVKDGIEPRHDGQQRLRGADVRGGLFAADMLFARLQRQAIGLISGGIDGHAHDAAGHGALELVAAGHECRMRSAIAHRHPEALRRADADIGPHRAGFLQQAQRQQVRRDDRDRPRVMQRGTIRRQVADMAERPRILKDRAEHLRRVQRLGRATDDPDSQRRGAGFDHGDGLRVQVVADEERLGLRFRHAVRHRHRLGRGGRLVQQAGIGDGQAGQIGHHRLIVQQRLKPSLGDFRLIGCIGGIPGRVFQNVALDRRWRDGAVIALSDQAGHHPVLPGHLAHQTQQLAFRQRRPVQRGVLADRLRHGLVDQLVQRADADGAQHVVHLGDRRADMAAIGEIVGVVGGGGPAGHDRP